MLVHLSASDPNRALNFAQPTCGAGLTSRTASPTSSRAPIGRFSCERSKSTSSWSPASGQRDGSGSIAARTRVLISVTCESSCADPSGDELLPRASQLSPTTPSSEVQLRLVDGPAGLARRPDDDPLEPPDGLRRRLDGGERRREVAVGGALGDGDVGGDGGVDLHRPQFRTGHAGWHHGTHEHPHESLDPGRHR